MQSSFFFLFLFLPLNKKSYSSSRFPILDEAAPTLVSGRGWMKSMGMKCRYMPERNVGKVCGETLRQFWMSRRAGRRRGELSTLQREGRSPCTSNTFLVGALFTGMPADSIRLEPTDSRLIVNEKINRVRQQINKYVHIV